MFPEVMSVLEKLTRLLDYKSRVTRAVFDGLIEPIYKDLRPIVEDYYSVLADVRRQLEDPLIPMTSVVDHLAVRRERLAVARHELVAFSAALRTVDTGTESFHFANACHELLSCDPAGPIRIQGLKPGTTFSNLLEGLTGFIPGPGEPPGDPSSHRKMAAVFVDACSMTVRQRWSAVADDYLRLRTACYGYKAEWWT